ncbi:hypothetical protein Tco_0960595 [Tanacetum coccineum]
MKVHSCGYSIQQLVTDQYSKPMPWIGMYIAVASLFCILAMVADLLHGLKNRKLWFPCKFFTLNAASLTVIAVAMKLPVDLSNPMLGYADQIAKFGSMGFMCTMMANLLPSLATMNSSELLTNIIALDILTRDIAQDGKRGRNEEENKLNRRILEASLFPTHLHHFGHNLSVRTPIYLIQATTKRGEKELQLSMSSCQNHPTVRANRRINGTKPRASDHKEDKPKTESEHFYSQFDLVVNDEISLQLGPP